ncbi:MAG: YraN family protein [Candidatus Krumholzibacteria bacterium]|nr:YraN family protein [Candidatus Krumholzibacteria bacterium]
MSKSHRLGQWGENVARVFLELCGYRCIDQRYRRPGGEIDLILRQGSTLVFVEVKTRGPGALAPAEAYLSRAQQRRLRRLALQWLSEHQGQAPGDLRFDLVAVEFEGASEGASIRHLAGIG